MWERTSSLRGKQSGFTVVELLITLGIILGVFGAFVITFTTIQNINKKALDVVSANTMAFSKMEEYENKNYTDFPQTTPLGTLQQVEDFSASLPPSLRTPRTGKVYINTISSSLKQVVVTITYSNGTGTQSQTLQYANFVQRNGIGR